MDSGIKETEELITPDDVINFINSGNKNIEEHKESIDKFKTPIAANKNIEEVKDTKIKKQIFFTKEDLTDAENDFLLNEVLDSSSNTISEKVIRSLKTNSEDDNKIKFEPENKNILSEGPDVNSIELTKLTDTDKENYIRATLDDTALILSIDLLRNKYHVHIKSLSLDEEEFIQKYITKKLESIIKGSLNYSENLLNDLFQKSTVALGLVAIQGGNIWEENINLYSESSEDSYKKLENRINKLNTFPRSKWQLILQAFKIFEYKQARLAEFVANEDFWKPLNTEES